MALTRHPSIRRGRRRGPARGRVGRPPARGPTSSPREGAIAPDPTELRRWLRELAARGDGPVDDRRDRRAAALAERQGRPPRPGRARRAPPRRSARHTSRATPRTPVEAGAGVGSGGEVLGGRTGRGPRPFPGAGPRLDPDHPGRLACQAGGPPARPGAALPTPDHRQPGRRDRAGSSRRAGRSAACRGHRRLRSRGRGRGRSGATRSRTSTRSRPCRKGCSSTPRPSPRPGPTSSSSLAGSSATSISEPSPRPGNTWSPATSRSGRRSTGTT